jgi:UDP-glucose 4-epimerase
MGSSEKEKIMKILVTGAAGFMGSHLVDALLTKGDEVYGVDDLSGGYMENVNPKSRFTKLDLRDKQKTEAYINKVKPQIIFHLAADATEGRSQFTPISATERNYLAYLYVLIPSIRNGLKKVVITSSMSVYGAQKTPFVETMPCKPEDLYAISKTAMERATQILSHVHGFDYTIIRPHNVYGPRQNMADPYRNVIAIFINCLLQNKNFYIYGDGNQKRAFSYIDDFTPYILKTRFDRKTNGEIFNIGPVKEYTVNELSRVVLNAFFPDGNVPKHLKPKNLPFRPMEIKDAWCTAEKAEKLLGYKTTVDLTEGVARMVAWAKKRGVQKFKYMDNLEIVNDKTPLTWKHKLI